MLEGMIVHTVEFVLDLPSSGENGVAWWLAEATWVATVPVMIDCSRNSISNWMIPICLVHVPPLDVVSDGSEWRG